MTLTDPTYEDLSREQTLIDTTMEACPAQLTATAIEAHVKATASGMSFDPDSLRLGVGNRPDAEVEPSTLTTTRPWA